MKEIRKATKELKSYTNMQLGEVKVEKGQGLDFILLITMN